MLKNVSSSIISSRLSALRLEMMSRDIDAYIITSEDNHSSEYVGDYFKVREYFSGFTGSAGILVITKFESALWTDGRYFLQAAEQLDGTEIELMKQGVEGTPSIAEYLLEAVSQNGKIAFNGLTVSCNFIENLEKKLSENNISMLYSDDLAALVWDDRPGMSCEPVWELKLPGQESRAAKLEKVRARLSEKNCDCLLLTALDQIAWLLNLRGNDIRCCPVFLSYMFISQSDAVLFVNPSILSDDILEILSDDGITIHKYDEISDYLSSSCTGKNVWADKKWTSFTLMRALDKAKEIETSISPVEEMKAIKSEAEQIGERNAHIRDGAALTKFIYWLKSSIGKEKITELGASKKLLSLRQQQDGFFDISFDTIMGYGCHGAIIHYEPTEDSDIEMRAEGFCLVDSGAQYYDGTTDVTRTVSLGKLTPDQKKHYTLVLKGHLALGHAVFKKGTTGLTLDQLARKPLKEKGLDYLHGTGHGVGCVLNVHEGPQRISTVLSDYEFMPGMVTSNEPGLYLEGQYGIRIENIVLCRNAADSEDNDYLSFETLTLAPYDRDSIDISLLSLDEKDQINKYHKIVFNTLSPYLSDEENLWLKKETSPL